MSFGVLYSKSNTISQSYDSKDGVLIFSNLKLLLQEVIINLAREEIKGVEVGFEYVDVEW